MTARVKFSTRTLLDRRPDTDRRFTLARAAAATLLLPALVAGGCSVGTDDSAPGEDVFKEAASVVTWTLGARYDGTKSNILFNMFSGAATRVEVYLYTTAIGADDVAHFALTQNTTTKVWSTSVSVATLQSKGLTGTVYYGYRAWGPNWPFSASWTKGSSAGFIADVDASGNRFNPNKLLLDMAERDETFYGRAAAEKKAA